VFTQLQGFIFTLLIFITKGMNWRMLQSKARQRNGMATTHDVVHLQVGRKKTILIFERRNLGHMEIIPGI
jgi:hypothetical protein